MKDSVKRIVIVGTGFSGSIIAREIAEKLDMPVTVVELLDASVKYSHLPSKSPCLQGVQAICSTI